MSFLVNPYSFSSVIPNRSDALVWLDGEIQSINGSYYFLDKSGNNRHFLITGYDFPTGWTRGFPYKSAATISAPSGDATLIAADLNSYLYTAGTPNAINVVSLFQDVDYEHKMFSRHTSRVVNGNSEEITDNRVVEFVVYNSVRAGADLTACQSYFSVPTEVTSNVHWISKAGNNTTGTGTKANPWLTLSKATFDSGTAGYTVYVKSGDYLEDHNTSGTGSWFANKNMTVIGIGRVLARSNSTGQVNFINATITFNVKGMVIGNASSSTGVMAQNASFTPTVTIENCILKNGFAATRYTNGAATTLINCVMTGITNRLHNPANTTFTMTGCYSTSNVPIYVSGASALTTVRIKYNKVVKLEVVNNAAVDQEFDYNYITDNIYINGVSGVTNSSSKLYMRYNTVVGTSTVTVLHNYFDTRFQYNYVAASSGAGSAVFFTEQTTLRAQYNRVINASGSGRYSSIAAGATTALAKTYYITDNVIISDASYVPVQIGDEVTSAGYNTVTCYIEGNDALGTGAASDAHGMDVFNQSTGYIRRNYVKGYDFGFIVKVNGTDLSNFDISYNVSEDCSSGISTKGGANQKIYNNTIIDATSEGLSQVPNDLAGGNNTLNTQFFNNIIVETGGINASYAAIRNATGCTLTSNNNVFYSLNNSNQFNNGTTNITFAAWQALGRDASSITTNPNLNSSNYPASPVLIGADLGDSYDTGLDITTTWGSSTTVPVIVTRDQQADAPWEVGAYVQR